MLVALPIRAQTPGSIGDVDFMQAGDQFWMEGKTIKCPALSSGTGIASSADIAALIKCIETQNIQISKASMDEIKATYKKRQREEWWDTMKDKAKEAMAGAFKKSLESMARQIGKDTAVWVASGGRGQKPLFITEGWGAYVKNAGDVALGDFIDQVGQSFGVDLCEPDFNVKLAILVGIDDRQTARVRCSFSDIMSNWESAIASANFSVEYQAALRPGENDISVALMLADQKNSYVAEAVEWASKEAEIPELWSDIKDISGKILTPGSMIHDKFSKDTNDTSKIGWDTFTNTIWDLLGSFLDTLVGQLALNLKSGFFSSDNSSAGGDNLNLPNLDSLFTPWSSPVVAGIRGAEDKFAGLKGSTMKIGGEYDLINKLTSCQDPNNPGPMDCVLDQELASAIRQGVFVKDLPSGNKENNEDGGVLNRPFAPFANNVENPSTHFSRRQVTILRKYRIVPVGWEKAVQVANERQEGPTLKSIMDQFSDPLSPYFGLIDPYWVLKAPDMFCRREGFGPQNSFSGDQDGTIYRNEYCADEQQCIKETDNGQCLAYGYCTEERKTFNFGKSCDARFNTCNTYVDRAGQTNYWLSNTLDFRDCDQSVVGCRWFSTEYNPVSQYWVGSSQGNFYGVNNTGSGQLVSLGSGTGWKVKESQYVSENKRLVMALACDEVLCKDPAMNGKCSFATSTAGNFCEFASSLSCDIPAGGINCRLPICDSQTDALASGNGGFESQEDIYTDNAQKWSDELSFVTMNNRAYREADGGKSGAGLRLLANGSPSAIILASDPFSVESGSSYHLKFDIRGSIASQGKLMIFVYGGDKKITSNDFSDINILNSIEIGAEYEFGANWYPFRGSEFKVQDFATATIAIMAPQGTFADIRLDNFSLNKVDGKCFENSVTVFSATQSESAETSKDIYFDRDAQACSAASAGCSQFLRLKGGAGTNLIYNGGFEYGDSSWTAYWGTAATSPVEEIVDGKVKLRYSSQTYSTYWPVGVETDAYYAVSFDASQTASINNVKARFEMVFVENKNNAGNLPLHRSVVETNCSAGGDQTINLIFTPESTSMERKSCWFRVPVGAKVMMFKPFADTSGGVTGSNVYFDNLKIEKVTYPDLAPTAYAPYDPGEAQARQVTYLRKAPDYFNCYYYKAVGIPRWPTTPQELDSVLAGRSLACSQFAGVCLPSEVGCELYKPLSGDPTVPGVANDIDVCPQECAGYQVYKQEFTRFVNDKYRQFIADNKAKYCSASYAGCDEFTNLDELGRGAEAKEYYSAIRACQKPDVDDGAFYTWEGSDTTGYQLKAYNLKKSTSTDPDPNSFGGVAPCVNLYYDSLGKPQCQDPSDWPTSREDFQARGFCTVNDLVTNADCRQFYDVDGKVHYRLLSRTVSVSNNCHPYRRTMTQNSMVEAQEDCESHNGWWKDSDKECIYMAIPGEGMKCPASAKGCRAYTGNRGNNVRNVIEVANFGLQSSTTGSWVGADGTANGLFVSSESTFPGGNSLMNKNTITIKHPVKIKKGKTYVLSFWAKGSATFNMDSIKFSSAGNDAPNYFAVKQIQGENLLSSRPTFTQDWNLYELGPVFVNWDPSDNEHLEFNLPSGAGVTAYNIYLDNVILKEVVNKVYAIENSWYTPVACDNTLEDPDGSKGKNLPGCDDSASGRCSIGEMLGCAGYTTRANQTVYLRSFASLCRPEAAGCEALIDTKNNATPLAKNYHEGDPSEVRVPADEQIYMVNNSPFACPASDKGCTAYGLPFIDQQDNSVGYQSVFIKNQPDRYETDLCYGNNLWCEEYAGNGGARYFKEPHNKICVYGSAIASVGNSWYKLGTKGDPCDVTLNQTYGTGYGSVDKKQQPVGVVAGATYSSANEPAYSGWVGACPQTQSSCTEFVDPLTEMYVGERITSGSYFLTANSLYSISDSGHGAITVASSDCLVVPQEKTEPGKSGYLYYLKRIGTSSFCNVTISGNLGNVKVSKAGVYYKLAGSVDKSSCNGQVDFNNGCILFNERGSMDYSTTTIVGRNRYLNFDSPFTYAVQKGSPSMTSVGPKTAQESGVGWGQSANNSDVILKVRPDRACSQWLACTSYIKGDGEVSDEKFGEKDYCLGVSACDDLSEDNQCSHLAQTSASPLSMETNDSRTENLNKTGYSIIGMYPVDKMDYKGQGALVGNGNFEHQYNSGKPVGWNPVLPDKAWEPSQFSVVSDGKNAPEGYSYLRVNFSYPTNSAKSENIDVVVGQKYYLSAWINTLSLKTSNSDGVNNERAEILVMRTGGGEITRMVLGSGLDWTRKTLEIPSTLVDVNSIYLMIRNSPDKVSPVISRNPVGYSLFDDIQITPVLDDNGLSPELSKTCRVYPASDAPACKYISGGVNYYGWYGYCLTPDPNRRSDCLQWFPVDKIKGELTSDYALGYDNRRPLYYCVDWDIVSINVSDSGMLGNIGENIGSDWKEKISSVITDNRQVTTVAFNVNPEYAGFMKYPYINRFIFIGGFGGITEKKSGVYLGISSLMYPHCSRGVMIPPFIPVPLPFWFGDCSGGAGTSKTYDFNMKSYLFSSCIAPHIATTTPSSNEAFWVDKFCKESSVGDSGRPTPDSVSVVADSPDPRYYGFLAGGYLQGYTWISDPDYYSYYNCLDKDPVDSWRSRDTAMSAGAFCNNNSFCATDNPGNSRGEQSCRDFCNSVLADTPLDDNIEKCLKDALATYGGTLTDNVISARFIRWIYTNIIGPIANLLWNDQKDQWGGFGMVGFTLDAIGLTPVVVMVPWHWAMSAPNIITTIVGAINLLKGFIPIPLPDDFVLGFGVSGAKIITDQDPEYGNSLTDPDPDSPGNVLGYAWLLNTSQMYGAGLVGNFSGYMNIPYCKAFVKTVGATGGNRAYYSQVGLGSSKNSYDIYAHKFKADGSKEFSNYMKESFSYNMDFMPYGAIVPPAGGDIDAPITWDSKTVTKINQASINLPGVSVSGMELIEPKIIGLNYSSSKQPLFFESPVLKYGAPYQARAGGGVDEMPTPNPFAKSFTKIGVYLNSTSTLQGLFAKTYGVFKWTWDSVKSYDPDWSLLRGLVATDRTNVYDCVTSGSTGAKICEPKQGSGGKYQEVSDGSLTWDLVNNVGKGSSVTNITTSIISKYAGVSVVKLQFNVQANVDQLPIKSYTIVWGDGEVDSISGAFLNDKPNASSAFTVYHTYDLNKMRAVASAPGPNVSSPCCYKFGSTECAEQSSNVANSPSCSGNSCSAGIFISVRDNWDKVNYCNPNTLTDGSINRNSIAVTISAE